MLTTPGLLLLELVQIRSRTIGRVHWSVDPQEDGAHRRGHLHRWLWIKSHPLVKVTGSLQNTIPDITSEHEHFASFQNTRLESRHHFRTKGNIGLASGSTVGMEPAYLHLVREDGVGWGGVVGW